MFESSVIKARVYTDETGISYEIPVLLTPDGAVEILVDYFVELWAARSPAWMVKVTNSIRLFLSYVDAHPGYLDEMAIFHSFRQRLLTGSVDRLTRLDETNLWWKPRSPVEANRIIGSLVDFFSWCARSDKKSANSLANPYLSRYDRQIAGIAFQYRRNSALLGHMWSSAQKGNQAANARVSNRYRAPKLEQESVPSFPESSILDLVLKGFKVGNRYNYRDMLITLLLNGAGFRESEPFHLYLWDVSADPSNPNSAMVLIHHPAWGVAPLDRNWVGIDGLLRKGTRVEYLAERYGLAPRDWALSSSAAGWKGGMHESTFGGYYKQAYWFVPEFGELFWELWHRYMEQVQRIPQSKRSHPYAFMNISREPIGDMYKLGKFEDSHAAAVRRIGLIPSKRLGTSPHGHRFAYGQRLKNAGVSSEMIRRFMHHSDIESQQVYTEPDRNECLLQLSRAVSRLSLKSAELRGRIIAENSLI